MSLFKENEDLPKLPQKIQKFKSPKTASKFQNSLERDGIRPILEEKLKLKQHLFLGESPLDKDNKNWKQYEIRQ